MELGSFGQVRKKRKRGPQPPSPALCIVKDARRGCKPALSQPRQWRWRAEGGNSKPNQPLAQSERALEAMKMIETGELQQGNRI
jgi:hypothetical protein